MVQSTLMKKGLESLFNPANEFKREAAYGKRILYVAWAVEILAALIGLSIAFATAYDAYHEIDNRTQSHLINALIGALPFVIIAVIEPTKIPLAGGFYKTRIFGWKLLILIALIGLTAVTFETMFNGLERNLTNVTRAVVVSDNKIQYISDQVFEKQRRLEQLKEKSEVVATKDLQESLQDIYRDYQNDIDTFNLDSAERRKPIQENKLNLEKQVASLSVQAGQATKQQIDALNNEIEVIEKQIYGLEIARDKEISDYKESVRTTSEQNTSVSRKNIEFLETQQKQKTQDLKDVQSEIEKKKKAKRENLETNQQNYDDLLSRLSQDQEEAVDKAGFFDTSRVNKQFEQRRVSAIDAYEEAKQRIKEETTTEIKANEERIELLLKELSSLEKKISNSIAQSSDGVVSINNEKLTEISKSYNQRINRQRKKRDKSQGEISSIIKAQSGTALIERDRLQAEIKILEKQIQDITINNNNKIENRTEAYTRVKEEIDHSKNKLILSISAEKDEIPIIESSIRELNEKIDNAKKIKREASHKSQVYRLAALMYGKTDVAEVTREEIRVVSIAWFGSIALIVSTIGTILALISQILQDPEAFVERKKISLTRRISRLSYLIFWRANRLLMSAFNILIALSRLLLSFAEIFRGLVGLPVQRAIRRALLSYRKRQNKPKIVEVEIEVEKVVEKEVVKIVEVEKIVEKIVEVEVPVEKVAIKEVPVEIIRKELVYVPLYSTDSGLIDASTELKGAKPKLSDATQQTPSVSEDDQKHHIQPTSEDKTKNN